MYVNNIPDCFETLLKAESGIYEVRGSVDKCNNTEYGCKIIIKNTSVKVDNVYIKTGKAVVYTDKKYGKGDEIQITGKCELFSAASNPGCFDSYRYYKSLKIDYKIYADEIKVIKENSNIIYSLADKISQRITKSLYSITDDKYASILCAMLLGNMDELDEGTYDLFSLVGIGHILAISGFHISVIGMSIYKTVRKLGIGYTASMILSGALVIFYGIMTGNGTSTIRAVMMFVIMLYANVAGRTYDMVSASSLAGFLMLLDCPMLIYNGGFWLSFMAIAGIGGVNTALIKIFDIKNKFIKAFVSGIAVQITTIPVIMYLYYEIPIYSFLLNLIVIPLSSYLMEFAIFGGFAGCFSEMLGSFLIGISVYILKFYEYICEKSLLLPNAVWICGKPMLWQIILFYIILWLFLWLGIEKSQKRYSMGVLLGFIIVILRFNYSFEAVFLDVGQGDGIYIRSEDTTILVDCGSSDNSSLYEYTLEPFLLSKGVSRVQCVFITHPDKDHTSGIVDLLKEDKIQIETLILPYMSKPDEAYTELIGISQEAGTNVKYVYAGMKMSIGELEITCVHPDKEFIANDRNSYSTVLLVDYKDFDMLLTGDISSEEEKKLGHLGKIDVLKVAHHGSSYSSSMNFLNNISPDMAVISCGKDNSYGHPHNETLERLKDIGCNIKITSIDGAVVIKKGNMI